MQIDEEVNAVRDDDIPPNVQNVPLDIYPKIAACVDCVSDDLSNLCTSLQVRRPDANGNGEIVDKILGGNEEYLRHIVASTDTRDAPSVAKAKPKILQWMESNPNWTERCNPPTPSPQYFCRLAIPHSEVAKMNLHEFQPGVVSFQGYVGTKYTSDLPCEGDLLHSMSGVRVAGWTLEKVNGILSNVDVTMSPSWTHGFVFVRDANFIFSNPPAAIEFGLEPVLKHMIVNGMVEIGDRYSAFRRNQLMERTNQGAQLLYHAVFGSPDISCFQYLMSLPDIHSTFRMWGTTNRGGNLIHWCATSLSNFSVDALEMALQHPRAPGINDRNLHGNTALCLLCSRWEIPLGIRLKKLEMLLAYGADPLVGGALPIDILYQVSEQEQDKPEFKQMVSLLRKRT
mmetsp:Transcript_23778/g.68325  ORF Transcript_23778/g.68325 Transcript_23778/m.68325 type:complete len:398 (+) Transcript_23778:395-1588(+)